MKSASLVQYTPGSAGLPDKLAEVARHFDTLWGTAISYVAEHTFLQADAEGNLTVLEHDESGFSEEDRRRLRVTSEMLLGEMVNRIRPISITSPSPNAVINPRAFLATVEGGVYLFGLIAAGKQDLLIRLQQKIADVIRSPGNVDFGTYRGVKTQVRDMSSEGPLRFVDGEIVEAFLGMDEKTQVSVCEGLDVEVEETREMVESLRRLR